jgi:hypothetical protein
MSNKLLALRDARSLTGGFEKEEESSMDYIRRVVA